LVGLVIGEQSDGHGKTLRDLSTESGEAQTASTHADPLQRIALLGPAAMGGGRLDDLRKLIKNVAADSVAASCGCGC
jgi:hypothetical protein